MRIPFDKWFLPFSVDYEQMKQLETISRRYKVRLGGIPLSARVKEPTHPFMKGECVICGNAKETHAYPNLDFCLTCFKSYVDVKDYRGHHAVCLYSMCNRCGKFFDSGVTSFNVRVCTSCLKRIKGRGSWRLQPSFRW